LSKLLKKKMKIIKAKLANYQDRVDGTVSLKLDSLLEVPDSDIAEIRGMRGNIAIAVITDVVDVLEADISTKDIMEHLPEDPFLDTRITPSQQQRRDLFVIQEKILGRKPTKEEQAKFYIDRMARIHEENLQEIRELDNLSFEED
jgi:hypothetical protein